MKKMLVLSLCLISFNSFSDHHEEKNGKTFAEKKAIALEGLEKRISFINETKSCVSSATDEAGLKACREKAKAQHKAWKEAKKQKRAEKKK